MFETILVANRGEIACRVMRTLKRLGIRSVAVCSEADRGALFTRLADEVVEIGPSAARDSYLRGDRILAAAARTGAQAIHPGYGFLSENAEFALQCRDAGVRFIGPSPSAIAAMGLKDAAKALMEKAGVAVVPGYHGSDQAEGTLLTEADRIGYPVLIKAVAGGGGKGMRRVDRAQDFASALEGARREAMGAFGDERVLIEKYLTRPRHIEVQVFADSLGNTVHLFERDCSLQRRHQKVVEEAPAPGMPEEMRALMGRAAVRAARAIGYEGAGTIEFIADVERGLDLERFYFMEMNTRLQVEHPVTELITGLDLVEWQIRVAAGERLPFTQEQIELKGHALEVRLYAEDPFHEFLPQTGELLHLVLPEETVQIRVDTGVTAGDVVSVFYDPMLAKLVTWGPDRESALRQMRAALAQVEVAGVVTNLPLLTRVAWHPAFLAGDVHTGFLMQHQDALLSVAADDLQTLRAFACVGHLLLRQSQASSGQASDRWSPWNDKGAFRLNAEPSERLLVRASGEPFVADVTHRLRGYTLSLAGTTYELRDATLVGTQLRCTLNGRRVTAMYVEREQTGYVAALGTSLTLEFRVVSGASADEGEAERSVKAPMPGRISAVLVAEGESIEKNAALVRLEAMKMEHTLRAKAAGVVTGLSARLGEQVEAGTLLLMLRPSEEK